MAALTAKTPPSPRGLPRRHVMVLLCAACCFLNYADRVNASVAIIPMAASFAWDFATQSWFLSAFFFGYMPMQIAGAELCRRFGGKLVLGCAAVWYSLFTLLTPLAADTALPVALVCRFLMGLGEALTFPGIYHFLAGWVPAEERSRATAVFTTGVHCGTTTALLISPWLIEIHSWRMVFWFFGALGFLWVTMWRSLAQDCPNPPTAAADLDAPPGPTDPATLAVYKAIFTSRACWAIIVISFTNNFCHYTIMAWMPSYFQAVFGVRVEDLGFTFIPYMAMAIATNLGGVLADMLTKRALDLTTVRRTMTIAGNVGAATFMVVFGRSTTAFGATSTIAAALAMQVLNTGGYESAFLDVADPNYTGTLKAIANTLSSLAGIVCMPYTAWVLRVMGSWQAVFISLSLFYLAGAAVFTALSSSDRILTPDRVRSFTAAPASPPRQDRLKR